LTYTSPGATLTYTIRAVDAYNNTDYVGGNYFIVKYTDNYGNWYRGNVTDAGTGLYDITMVLPAASGVANVAGKGANNPYTVHVYVVNGLNNLLNGLTGTYYNNRWLQGSPALVRVDPFLNFNWGTDLVTPTAANYVSVQWTGYIRPLVTPVTTTAYGTYYFGINADDSVRLYIDGVLVIDTWKQSAPGLVTGSFTFPQFLTGNAVSTVSAAGLLYDITIQYRQNTNFASIYFYWSTTALTTPTAANLVPNAALFSGAQNITGSPYLVTAV